MAAGLQHFFNIVMIIYLIVICFYVAMGIVLFKLNKLIYGNGSAMAWIPIFNVYLLGKLTVNKVVGFVLIIGLFLISNFSIKVDDVQRNFSILPYGKFKTILTYVYGIVILCFFIFAIVKYIKLKKEKGDSNNVPPMNNNVPPMNNNVSSTNVNDSSSDNNTFKK